METLWSRIRQEAEQTIQQEPALTSFLKITILEQKNLYEALAHYLSDQFNTGFITGEEIHRIFIDAFRESKEICSRIAGDLASVGQRDPACTGYLTPFLYFKGFHALESSRVSHWLWLNNRKDLALMLQSLIARIYAVDIHPAARIGERVMFDHATSIVIGETAVVGDDVSMLHEVTLGGTGNQIGDRHPKVGKGVMIGSGAKLLGNITIGEGAKIGAGSVVLKDVPAHTTVAGVPAKIVGTPRADMPSMEMNQSL